MDFLNIYAPEQNPITDEQLDTITQDVINSPRNTGGVLQQIDAASEAARMNKYKKSHPYTSIPSFFSDTAEALSDVNYGVNSPEPRVAKSAAMRRLKDYDYEMREDAAVSAEMLFEEANFRKMNTKLETSNNPAVASARKWVGKAYKPGDSAQCANFVREAGQSCGSPFGVSARPLDYDLIPDQPQGPGYANSLFGPEVGTLVPVEDMQPGDLVGYTNTYDNYPEGTITHVGIYSGNGKKIHRPTKEGTVLEDDVGTPAYVLRPHRAGKNTTLQGLQFRTKNNSKEFAQLAARYGFFPSSEADQSLYVYGGGRTKEKADAGELFISQPYSNGWSDDKERVVRSAESANIDPSIAMNLVEAESAWRSDASSSAGAFGLTQLMPETALEQARDMGYDVTLHDIKTNPALQIQLGMNYLQKQLQDFGNYPQALAAYNAGPGNVAKFKAGEQGVFAETKAYVSKILGVSEDDADRLIKKGPSDSENNLKYTRFPSPTTRKERENSPILNATWEGQKKAATTFIKQTMGMQLGNLAFLSPGMNYKTARALLGWMAPGKAPELSSLISDDDIKMGFKQTEIQTKKAVSMATLGLSNALPWMRVTENDEEIQKEWIDEFVRQGGVVSGDGLIDNIKSLINLDTGKNKKSESEFWNTLEGHLAGELPSMIALAIPMNWVGNIGKAKTLMDTAPAWVGSAGLLAPPTQRMLQAVGAAKVGFGATALGMGLKTEIAMGVMAGTEMLNRRLAQFLLDENMSPTEAFYKAASHAIPEAIAGIAIGSALQLGGFAGGALLGSVSRGVADIAQRPAIMSAFQSLPPGVRTAITGFYEKTFKELPASIRASMNEQVERHVRDWAESNMKIIQQAQYRSNSINSHIMGDSYSRQAMDVESVLRETMRQRNELNQSLQAANKGRSKLLAQYPEVAQNKSALDSVSEDLVRYQEVLDNLKQQAEEMKGSRGKGAAQQKSQLKDQIKQVEMGLQKKEALQAQLEARMDTPQGQMLRAADETVARLQQNIRDIESGPVMAEKDSLVKLNKVYNYISETYYKNAERARALSEGDPSAIDPDMFRISDLWNNITDEDKELTKGIQRAIFDHAEAMGPLLPQEMDAQIRLIMQGLSPVRQLQERPLGGEPTAQVADLISENLSAIYDNIPDRLRETVEPAFKQMKDALANVKANGMFEQDFLKNMDLSNSNYSILREAIKQQGGLKTGIKDPGASLANMVVRDETVRRHAAMRYLSILNQSPDSELPPSLLLTSSQRLANELREQGAHLNYDEDLEKLVRQITSVAGTDAKVDDLIVMANQAMRTLGKFDDSHVVMSGREMIGSSRAFQDLGYQIENYVKAKADDVVALINKDLDVKDHVNREDLMLELADGMLGGDVSSIMSRHPEMKELVAPIAQIQAVLSRYNVMTGDMRSSADHFYLRDVFPRMRRYDKASKPNARSSMNILKDAGLIDRNGKLTSKLSTVRNQSDLLEKNMKQIGVTWEEFARASQERRARIVNRLNGIHQGGLLSEEDVLAHSLLGDSISEPATLLKSRVHSVGKAETQRKFLDRMFQTYDAEGAPMLRIRERGDTQPDGIPLTDVVGIDRGDYTLSGREIPFKDIYLHKDAADYIKNYLHVSEDELSSLGTDIAKTINAVGLSGSHLPFLFTIGGNVWKMFGFNWADTAGAFNLRNAFTDAGEWSTIMMRAHRSGLELQSVEKNTAMMTAHALDETAPLRSELANLPLNQPSLGKGLIQLIHNYAQDIRSSEGLGKVAKLAKIPFNAVREVDEWAMEHLLFNQLRDAQVGAWTMKADEFYSRYAPEMIMQGMTPAQARAETEKMASNFVNTYTGSMEKGFLSNQTMKRARLALMTPQWFSARMKAAVSAWGNQHFMKNVSPAVREKLIGEYRWMMGKGLVAGMFSAAALQWSLGMGSIFDNPRGREMDVHIGGDVYVNNPLFAMDKTLMNLMPTGMLARAAAHSTLGKNPNSQEASPEVMARQFGNLLGPALKAGSGVGALREAYDPLNPVGSTARFGARTMADTFGIFQQLSGINPWTGNKDEKYKTYLEAMGVYATENNAAFDMARNASKSKNSVIDTLQGQVHVLLQAAKHNDKLGNREEAIMYLQRAWQLADPQRLYQDGGIETSAKQRKLFFGDSNYGEDGRVRLTMEQWSNELMRVGSPDEYALKRTDKDIRPQVEEGIIQKEMERSRMQATPAQGPAGTLLRGISNSL